jgi:hypothetical protein
MKARRLSGGALALRVGLLGLIVGAVGTAAAVSSAWGACDPPDPSVAGDPVCYSLVRTLSERMGVAAAVATVVIVLTMVGLSRFSVDRAEGVPLDE